MDQKRIDRLFREKLDGMEVTPAAQSWEKVERQISNGSQGVQKVYWAAAATAAILIGWLAWPTEVEMALTPIASDVNHPMVGDAPTWSLPVIAKKQQEKEPALQKPARVVMVAKVIEEQPEIPQDIQPVDDVPSPTPFKELDRKIVVAEAHLMEPEILSGLDVEMEAKERNTSIRITYIGSNDLEEKQKSDSVGGFKRFIARAGKFSPGEVLADIRTAKSDFLNGGLKNKQKDKRSL